jgi:hypothetical protein
VLPSVDVRTPRGATSSTDHHTDVPYGRIVLAVTSPGAPADPLWLTRDDAVAALFLGMAPEDDPCALTSDEVFDAVWNAVLFDGVFGITRTARRFAVSRPGEQAEARFLVACEQRMDAFLVTQPTLQLAVSLA